MADVVRLLFLALFLGACGEKRNPDRCCVAENDCAAIGLPTGSTCPSGETCRGNECVELRCATSSQCDSILPYCEEAHCVETCTSDSSCPGAEQANTPYCVAGSCAQCRATTDCAGRVCVNGSCTGCAVDGECESGVCLVATQTCAAADEVAWVTPSGSSTSDCTKTQPCTLGRALALIPFRETIKLENGVYANDSTIVVSGKRTFSGQGAQTTRITNAAAGPVFLMPAGSDVSLEGLQVFGAKAGPQPGIGVQCIDAKLRMDTVHVLMNASDGVDARCDISINRTTIKGNGGFGARLVGTLAAGYTIQRSIIARNAGGGVAAKGRGVIENSFVVNNTGRSLELSPNGAGPQATRPSVNFVTAARGVVGCQSGDDNTHIPLTNMIFFESGFSNGMTPDSTPVCTVGPCISRPFFGPQLCNEIGYLAFVDPENDDFHVLSTGTPVTDTASGGVGLVDYDGDVRPKGAAADMGADEAE